MRCQFLKLATFIVIGAASAVSLASAAELKLGVLGSLSGPGTEWGLATQRGVEIAIDEINKAGGLKVGNQTYTITPVMYDDQNSGQGGTTAATRMINVDGIKFIIGPIGSPPTLGALGVTGPNKVIMMDDGFAPQILKPDSPYNFRVSLTTYEFAPPIAGWLKKTFPNAKRVGVISPNDSVGQSVTPIQVESYKNAGYDVVFDEKYERGMIDFTPLLTRMMTNNVDIFELDGNAPGDAGLLVKQIKQLGFKGIIIQTGGPTITQIIKIAGPLANGVYTYDIFDPEDPAAQAFVKAYSAKWSGPINAYAPVMYNGAKILFEALRRAGTTTDTDKVRSQLANLGDYQTLFGKVRWSGKSRYGIDHQLLTNFYVTKVEDQKLKIVVKLQP